MMRYFMVLSLLLLPLSTLAQETVEQSTLMKDAIFYAAQADAYNMHCKKDSSLADDFIRKFEKEREMSEEQVVTLKTMQTQIFKETQDMLNADNADCKDINFMMARLDVMEKLKDISYRINGVDLETVPQDTPPEMQELPQDL